MPRFLWKKGEGGIAGEQFYAASAFGSIFLVLLDNQQVQLLEVPSHPTTSTPPPHTL